MSRVRFLALGLLASCLVAGSLSVSSARVNAEGVSLDGDQAAILGPYSAAASSQLTDAAAGALRSGVDPDLLTEVSRRAGLQGLSSSELLRVFLHAERLSDARLPVAPVLGRYLKGMAMGYPFARIEGVAGDLERSLAEAAILVDAVLPRPVTAEAASARLVAIHDAEFALKAGVDDATLEQSLALVASEADPLGAARAPLYVMGVLVASGLDSGRTLEFVSQAWTHGYRGPDLERLGSQVGTVASDGRVDEVVRDVLRQIQTDTSKENVFQGLDELIGREQSAYRPPGVGPGDDPNHGSGDVRRRDKPTEGRNGGDKGTMGPR